MTNKDETLKNAQLRLAEIQQEAENIKIFISMYGKFAPEKKPNITAIELNSTVPTYTTPTKDILQTAAKVLEEEGYPLQTAALYEKVIAQGVTVGGMNPKGNLSAKLHGAKKQFCQIPQMGWWLVNKEKPDQATARTGVFK